jgi:capsular exopolysaccharide synthesis family protein
LDESREQQFTFEEYLQILYRGRWIIVLCFAVVVACTTYFTLTSPPIYEATALIMVKEEGDIKRQIFKETNILQKDTQINNHIEILKSRTLAKDVIKRLQESPQADTLRFLKRNPAYDRFSLIREYRNLIGKPVPESKPPTMEEMVNRFIKRTISVIPKRETDVIELRVQSPDAVEAAFIANTWMDGYRNLDIRESQGEVSAMREFLEEKLKGVQQSLTTSEEALKDYKETHGVTELTAETEQMIKQAADFESSYQAAKTEFEANQTRLQYLKGQLDESQRSILDEASSISSPIIQELQKQMAQLIAEKAAYEQQLKGAGYNTTTDTKLRQMEQRLKGVQESLLAETKKIVTSGTAASINPLDFSESLLNNILQIETENKSLKAKTEALGKIVQKFNLEMNALREKSLKRAQLQREAEVSNSIFMMLREKYEESRIAEASQIGSVRIVDYAEPPRTPIKPKKKINILLGIMVGLGLGIGVTFAREYIDTSLRSIEDVERLQFPVLGTIPFIASQKMNRQLQTPSGELIKIESRLVTHFAPNSSISEAYRSFRTNIQYAKVDQPVHSMLVTSPGPGEGKSTSAANLAITFAQMGAKTLLIDADLRRPVMHGIFGQVRDEGLTNVLVGKLLLEDAVKAMKIRNLYLLTSGTPPKNPSEFLASKVMNKLLKKVESQFDVVILDTPPVIAVTDAAVLAPHLDGVVLVIRSEKTQRDALFRSKVLLQNVKAKIFGVLINGLNISHRYGSYYKYYTYS